MHHTGLCVLFLGFLGTLERCASRYSRTVPGSSEGRGRGRAAAASYWSSRLLEHLECSYQPHIQGRGAKKRTQRAG